MFKSINILLVSVCIIVNGYYYDTQDRRTNSIWANLMYRYDDYEDQSRNYWDNYNKRSVINKADPDNQEYKREKLSRFVDDLVEYAKQRSHFNEDSLNNEVGEDLEFLQNQQFHKDDNGDVDSEEPVISRHDLRMPGVVPKERDTYLCYAYELPKDDRYITKFEPVAEMKTAHHMLLFGCETPFKKNVAWQCREMQPVCGSGSQAIKYAWGKNAPALTMPKDVAFHVGGKSTTKYLVVQVHYLNVDKFKDGKTKDRSGLTFTMTTQRPKFFAGIYLLAAGWPPIPPHKERFHMDMGCDYEGGIKFYPFRFRVHAHKLGAVITGYRVREGKWKLIGRGDPQRPQAFYKVMSDVSIEEGDQVVGRCTFNSTTRDKRTYIGATHSDEMCNFYIMYFYDAEKFGNIDQLPCGGVDTTKLKYPKDSDVTLAEVEKKNSLLIHNALPKYTQTPNWPKDGQSDGELPTGENVPKIGQIAGVDFIDVGKNVILFHRGSRRWDMNTFDMNNNLKKELQKNPIQEQTLVWLEKNSGKFIKSAAGKRFYLPHGITVDRHNNIWVTDVGSHQVKKLSPDGKDELMVLGEKFVSGSDETHFCKPTDVAVAADGNFFVSDGYCNSRILKFNSTGKVVLEISTPMSVVHSLALDEGTNKLYVADRENHRVLVFGGNSGKLLSEIKFKDPVYAVAYNPANGGLLHVLTGINYQHPGIVSGITYSLKTKKVIGEWKPKQGFHNTHDLAVSKDNKCIIATEIGPNKVWKFLQKDEKKDRP